MGCDNKSNSFIGQRKLQWVGTSTFRIDDVVTDASAEQMITKITHVMNVNIMPNILAS